MANFCSRHQDYIADCKICNIPLPENYHKAAAAAKATGEVTCTNKSRSGPGSCGFTFYKTTNTCPLCGCIYDFEPIVPQPVD